MYNIAKQELRIRDLRRYGIQAIMLDSYNEITDILRCIEEGYLKKNIFISGSVAEYEQGWNRKSVELFTHCLAKKFVQYDYRVISGFGLGVGSTVINGALEEIMESKFKHVDEHLCLRPFPQVSSGDVPLPQLWESYRKEMIGQAGIAIFMFGNKKVDNRIVIADGMLKEFDIASNLGKIIIPVGSTGGATKEIYEKVKKDIDQYPYLKDVIEELGTETDHDKLVKLLLSIVKDQQIV